MNESALRRLPLAAWLLALLLAACSTQSAPPPLAGASMGGPFTLTDQNGRRVSDRDLAGKYRLIYFGYTFCPDVCPVDMQVIGAGLRRFEAEDPARAAKVQPIFITVDPQRDTPEQLKGYAENFHPRLIALTGSAAEIAEVARAYKVFYQPVKQADGEYLMDHSSIVYLMGRDGRYVTHFGGNLTAEKMAAAITEHL